MGLLHIAFCVGICCCIEQQGASPLRHHPVRTKYNDIYIIDTLLKPRLSFRLLADILTAIEDGHASLLNSPPLDPRVEKSQKWLDWQLGLIPEVSQGLLEKSIKFFDRRYQETLPSRVHGAIEAEIVQDMTLMQMQPSIREKYRRFVVIRSTAENQVKSGKRRDGVSL